MIILSLKNFGRFFAKTFFRRERAEIFGLKISVSANFRPTVRPTKNPLSFLLNKSVKIFGKWFFNYFFIFRYLIINLINLLNIVFSDITWVPGKIAWDILCNVPISTGRKKTLFAYRIPLLVTYCITYG